MYTRISESGGRRYLQLVEGHRDELGKVRIKVVANLGTQVRQFLRCFAAGSGGGFSISNGLDVGGSVDSVFPVITRYQHFAP